MKFKVCRAKAGYDEKTVRAMLLRRRTNHVVMPRIKRPGTDSGVAIGESAGSRLQPLSAAHRGPA